MFNVFWGWVTLIKDKKNVASEILGLKRIKNTEKGRGFETIVGRNTRKEKATRGRTMAWFSGLPGLLGPCEKQNVHFVFQNMANDSKKCDQD